MCYFSSKTKAAGKIITPYVKRVSDTK